MDTSVRDVVSFYGPVDYRDGYADVAVMQQRLVRRKRIRPYGYLIETLLHIAGLAPPHTPVENSGNYVAQLLGAEPAKQPDLYQQLSPAACVGPHCPPTLLLQGAADIFGMSRSVRQVHQMLAGAGVLAMLVEFPNTDHAFDLVLPRLTLSPGRSVRCGAVPGAHGMTPCKTFKALRNLESLRLNLPRVLCSGLALTESSCGSARARQVSLGESSVSWGEGVVELASPVCVGHGQSTAVDGAHDVEVLHVGIAERVGGGVGCRIAWADDV